MKGFSATLARHYQRFVAVFWTLLCLYCLTACDRQPVSLMPAVKPFGTEDETRLHVAEMRTHHMHLLSHQRDKTVYQGIRTQDYSLHACIECHVPAPTVHTVVRHDDPQHFCTTCHLEVAVKLDCFDCHADRPIGEITQEVTP